eukprot:PhM_4_TR8885/c0_g1_i1/m.100973/K19953/GRTP1, TBC1D6, MSB3_4; TBC1 domain family member 6
MTFHIDNSNNPVSVAELLTRVETALRTSREFRVKYGIELRRDHHSHTSIDSRRPRGGGSGRGSDAADAKMLKEVTAAATTLRTSGGSSPAGVVVPSLDLSRVASDLQKDPYGFDVDPAFSQAYAGFASEPDPAAAAGEWYRLCGAHHLELIGSGEYAQHVALGSSAVTNAKSLEAVQKDLSRTFPNNDKFARGTVLYAALRDVLLAYSVRYSDGYCQGMNFIAGALLLVLGADRAEDVYWMLARIVEDPHYNEDYYCQSMFGIRVDQVVMNTMAAEVFPDVIEVLERHHLMVGDFCIRWFLALCIDALPFHRALQFVDGYLREGAHFSFMFCLGVVDGLRDRILGSSDAGDVLMLFNAALSPNIDVLDCVRRGRLHGLVDGEELLRRRKDARVVVEVEERARQAVRAERLANLKKSGSGGRSTTPTLKNLSGVFRALMSSPRDQAAGE